MRSRNIKPGTFKNETLAECEPLARILFTGLWCMADREGRLEYRPKKIKAEILPYDDCDVSLLITQLLQRDFLLVYPLEKPQYIQITNFKKHQRPHMRESASTIPAPDEAHPKPEQGTAKAMPDHSQDVLIPDSLNLIPKSNTCDIESTVPPKNLPVDNSMPEVKVRGTPSAPPSEKPKNENGCRWTDEQGSEIDNLLNEIGQRYGQNYRQQCYVFVQTNFNRGNPGAILYCVKSLLTKRLAGKAVNSPRAWLEKALSDQNGKHNAAEEEKRCNDFKTAPISMGAMIGQIGRPIP